MFAEALFRWNVPYIEYWLPLVIGLGVGLVTVTGLKLVTHRRPPPPPPPEPKPTYDPFQQGSTTESRKTHRRGGNPVEVYYSRKDQKDQTGTAWVVDRSMGGLCLTMSEQFEAGTILSVQPINAPMAPWVDIEVRACRTVKDGFEVGCQFVRTPPWAVLLLFG